MTPEQIERAQEFQEDFCALEQEDFEHSNFLSWIQWYFDYIKYGTSATLLHPPKKPGGS